MEILFPILDETLQEKVYNILDMQLRDTMKAQMLQPDGTYKKIDKRGKVAFHSQNYFCEEATKQDLDRKKREKDERVFIPEKKPENLEEE